MPRRATLAAGGAALSAALLLLVWYATFHVGLLERADRSVLIGFADLHRGRYAANFIAHLCNPKPYVYLAAIPVLVALFRRRPRVALAIGAILFGANATTQLLKPLLAHPRAGLVLSGSPVHIARRVVAERPRHGGDVAGAVLGARRARALAAVGGDASVPHSPSRSATRSCRSSGTFRATCWAAS